jgi:hypothetical protein
MLGRRYDIVARRDCQQRFAETLRIRRCQTECRAENPSFMLSARMVQFETIVP